MNSSAFRSNISSSVPRSRQTQITPVKSYNLFHPKTNIRQVPSVIESDHKFSKTPDDLILKRVNSGYFSTKAEKKLSNNNFVIMAKR